MLFWASFRGMDDIVEKVIRMGYSPFLKCYKDQNALMAAIQGNNLSTVKLMVGFKYNCPDMDYLVKSK